MSFAEVMHCESLVMCLFVRFYIDESHHLIYYSQFSCSHQ